MDPQEDFCNPLYGSFVKIDVNVTELLCEKIRQSVDEIDAVVLMLDSHYPMDINHSRYWVDFEGNHPVIGTIITKKEVKGKKYKVFSPTMPERVLEEKQKMASEYLENLESTGKKHIIQSEHCILGTTGHNVYQPIMNEVLEWSKKKGFDYQIVLKGLHQHVEHFGVFEAVVPNPNVPETMLNQGILQFLDHFDDVVILGSTDVLKHSMIQLQECAECLNAPDIIDRYVVVTDDLDLQQYCQQVGFRFSTLNDLKI